MHRMIQNIYIVPLLISMLASLRTFRNNWPAPYKIFSVLLIAICVVETAAITWKYYFFQWGSGPHNPSNLRLYNIFLIPQYLLYMVVYVKSIGSKRIRTIIRFLALAYTTFSIVSNGYIQGLGNIDSFSIAFADSIVIFMTVAYFNELKDRPVDRLSNHPMAWISVGALIFHAANLPFIISLNYLIHYNLQLALSLLSLFVALNFLMYSFYTIAFLCPQPLTRS